MSILLTSDKEGTLVFITDYFGLMERVQINMSTFSVQYLILVHHKTVGRLYQQFFIVIKWTMSQFIL